MLPVFSGTVSLRETSDAPIFRAIISHISLQIWTGLGREVRQYGSLSRKVQLIEPLPFRPYLYSSGKTVASVFGSISILLNAVSL